MINKIKRKKVNIKNLLYIPIIICFFIFIFVFFSTYPDYQRVDAKIQSANAQYNELKDEYEYLNSLNLSDEGVIDDFIMKKAREEGYCFPDETVFYCIEE